ncbi:MAG TPA: protein kinase, partial [Gemmataceae bacterium]|nr:protein kinase [Gemmataceae bacterium]
PPPPLAGTLILGALMRPRSLKIQRKAVERAAFFDRLRHSRLLSESELQQAASRFRDDASSQAIADALVQEGMLTPFQVRQVHSGDTQPLSLGQYRLLDDLGRGGMGRVYKALHTIMGRVVAIKVISPELVSDPVAVEWFRREVRACTQLNHPNIVMAYDANEAEGLHFLVMEYVHGVTLDALVKRHGPLPITHACALMRQAALGLQHAHDKGMVHRDIKPGNLLIPHPEGDQPSERLTGGTPVPLVKILDFGLARLQGKSKGDTIALRGETGVLGTPDYIAPEQSRDIHAADIRSDLYSLGCAFYFTLAGRVPFPCENAMEKLVKHLMEQPEPLEKVRPDVPPAVAALVRRLMAKEPAERYQTPAELSRELDVWSAERPTFFPATRTSERPIWITPPTCTPSARPVTNVEPDFTRVLDSIEAFAPSQRDPERSGPSLLEPLWKYSPDEPRHAASHDTLSLSHVGETEHVTAEALLEKEQPSAAPRLDSDATQEELPAGETGVSPAGPQDPLPPVDPVVARLWQCWMDLLETIVNGSGPARVNGETYRTIHTLLLQACRDAIDAADIPERRAFYEECLSIAQPWLKLQTFVHTEPRLLQTLLERGKAIELELHDGKRPWTAQQYFGVVLLTLSSIVAALWYWSYGRRWLPSLFRQFEGEFTLSSLRSAWTVLLTHPSLLVGLIFPLVILFAISSLRAPRS